MAAVAQGAVEAVSDWTSAPWLDSGAFGPMGEQPWMRDSQAGGVVDELPSATPMPLALTSPWWRLWEAAAAITAMRAPFSLIREL